MSLKENINQIQWYDMSENEYKWFCNFELLKEYLKENNGEYPKVDEIYKGKKLGDWISRQRKIYNNGEIQEDGSIKYITYLLTNEQIQKLNEINFAWDYYKYNWNQNYELLKEYLKQNYGNYPKKREIYKEENIGDWIDTQRVVYANGELQEDGSIRYETYILTKEKIEKLNEINFIWNYHEYVWDQNYELLKEYLQEYNRNYTKSDEIYKGKIIGNWIRSQRISYINGEKQEDGSIRYEYSGNILTKEQVKKLNDIGFIWVFNKTRFRKRKIETKGQLEGTRRYLLNMIEKLEKEGIKEEELNKQLLLRL